MKNKQTLGIILVFSLIIGVFCGCKAKEPEFIPDTPEITFTTEDGETATRMVSEPDVSATDEGSGQPAVGTTHKEADKTSQQTEKKTTERTTDAGKKTTTSPDNSVETKPKATTTAKNTEKPTTPSDEVVTTTKKDETAPTKPTEPTTEFTTVKSDATITPITAEFTYLNDPKNSFIAKLTHKELGNYGMNESEKSAFLNDRSGWAEYTVRIDITNNDDKGAATVYYLDISDNGKGGVYVNCDTGGDVSIAPGQTTYILFDVLVKDGSMMETVVHKTVDEMTKKLKYAATPEHDMDVPNYKYITVE